MATGATGQNIFFPFLPTSLGGCKLWLDAADATTMTFSGSAITQWNDKSGSGLHVSNASGGATYTANGLTFSGTTVLSNATGYQSLVAANLFIVWSSTTASTRQRMMRIDYNGGYIGGYFDTTYFDVHYSSSSGYYIGPVSYSTGTTYLYSVNTAPGPILTYSINGTSSSSWTASETSAYGGTHFFIGGEASVPFNGNIMEVIYYDALMTVAQRQQVEGYLAWKWGLQGVLDASNPYKNAAPMSPTPTPTLNTAQITTIPLSIIRNKITNPMKGFTPASTGGLTLWLDGADPLGTGTPPALGALATWYDKSGNGRNASAESAASYSTDGIVFINGTFTSGNSYTMNVPYSANYSIFLVATNTTIAQCYFFSRNGTPGSSPTFIQGYIGSGIGLEWYEASDRGTIATTPSSPFIASVDHIQGTSIVGWYYGTQSFSNAQTQAYSGTAWTTLGKSVIGQNYYGGTMKELIFVGSNVTTPQRQQLEGYLAWKWGLQANLPPGHPYGGNSPFPSTTPLKTISISSIFKPTNYSGCQLWLDAFDPFGNGSRQKSPLTLTRWVDKSTNARHANMFNGTNISYSPTAFNNRPALLFTQTQNMSSAAAAGTFSSAFTFFIIYQRMSGGTYDTLVTRTAGALAAPLDIYAYLTNANFYRNVGNGTAQSAYNTASGSNFINVTTPSLYYANATPANGLLDAFNFATPTNPSSGVLTGVYYGDNGTAIYIGTRADSVTTLTASVSEVIVYSTTPSDQQRQTIEGYLAWKWGLVASLPAGHPYKNYPPPPQ
jgi:hypothetical protein